MGKILIKEKAQSKLRFRRLIVSHVPFEKEGKEER